MTNMSASGVLCCSSRRDTSVSADHFRAKLEQANGLVALGDRGRFACQPIGGSGAGLFGDVGVSDEAGQVAGAELAHQVRARRRPMKSCGRRSVATMLPPPVALATVMSRRCASTGRKTSFQPGAGCRLFGALGEGRSLALQPRIRPVAAHHGAHSP